MQQTLRKWGLTLFLGWILLTLIVLRWQIATLDIFDADELVHLHTAWLITHGSLPYKDFLTGYPPTFYLLLAPLMLWLPPSDFLPVLVRQLFFSIFLGSMFLFYKLARLAISREFSLIAVILVASSVFFVERGVEIRPDLLIIFLWLLSVWWLSGSRKHLFLAGLSTGLMAALTQKSIYSMAAILILVFFIIRHLTKQRSPEKRVADFIKLLLRFSLGLITVPLLVLLYLWQNDLLVYLPDFLVKYPLLLGGKYQWDHPWYHLGFIANFTFYNYFFYFYKGSVYWLRSSQVIWVLAIPLTIFWVVKSLFLKKWLTTGKTEERKFFLFFLGPGLFFSVAYLMSIPMKIPQYWLMPTPFMMLSLVFGLSELSLTSRYVKWFILILSCLSLTILTFNLWNVWTNGPNNRNNFEQRVNIKAVLANTKSTDEGYDGNGSYIFRHDCFYFSLSAPQEIPKSIFRDIMDSFTQRKCDFILRGPFSRIVDWNVNTSGYIETNFTPLMAAPDVLILNKK